MYFPKGYDNEISLELGNLIIEAYKQFNLYEKKDEWRLPSEYALRCELFYNAKQAHDTERSRESGFVRKLFTGKKDDASVPIGFIAEKGKATYIVFRGTQTSTEWFTNMNIKMERDDGIGLGNVHDGFIKLYKDIRDNLLTQVSRIDWNKRVYIAGHSLGGSLACLAAADIGRNAIKPIKAVYTYGSPRTGDREFASAYNKLYPDNSFRVVNTSDVITEVPFSVPIIGFFGGHFTHVDIPVVFTNQLEDIEKNHSIHSYVEYLEKHRVERTGLMIMLRKLLPS